ncbi:flavin reductase family protein [Garciella nitratireducens]|uniref:flavin reductase family protein n=1 Tax=Garciella nitratireducens TaxID=218205 RepID=UPI001BD6872D|nr:flavin reductase family protein [Garciella nitratireducens]
MSHFIELDPKQLQKNPFQLIGEDWMLVTAQKDGKANTMTASWGGVGILWGKNIAFIVLRPQRYTKTFVDHSQKFSLSFFDDKYKKILSYLGSVSGREEDKIAKSNLTLIHENNIPYFEEAKMSIFCKKLYVQEFQPECILDKEIDEKWYPDKDYHTMYVGEITKILIKKEK